MVFQHLGYVNRLTETAEKDHQASRMLFDKELFAQSIYFLQQSVEKLVKSYAILFEGFTPEDIRREIGHVTPRAFITPLVKWWSNIMKFLQILEESQPNHPLIEYIKISQPIFPEVEEFVLNYNKYKDNIKQAFTEVGQTIAKIDEANIKKVLSANRQSRTFVHEWLDNDENLTRDVEIILSSHKQTLPENIPEQEKEELVKRMRKRTKFFLNSSNMFTLAFITYPHVIYSRYPNNILSPHEYTKNLGIVKCFRRMSALLKETITWFKEDIDRLSDAIMRDLFRT